MCVPYNSAHVPCVYFREFSCHVTSGFLCCSRKHGALTYFSLRSHRSKRYWAVYVCTKNTSYSISHSRTAFSTLNARPCDCTLFGRGAVLKTSICLLRCSIVRHDDIMTTDLVEGHVETAPKRYLVVYGTVQGYYKLN